MKNLFYYSCIAISTLLFGCGKAVIIEAGINSETKSYTFTYNANKPLKASNTAYIIDMPETRTLKVDHWTTVIEPTIKPKLEGYDFQGWYMDIETKRKYVFTTPIAQDMNLYAKWTIKTYTLTFNPNKPTLVGNTIAVTGMPNPSSFSINHGISITAPTPAPELIKYDFEGWYTEKETIHKFIFTIKITQETQLYAKWVTKTHKVAFYPNKPTLVGNTIAVTGMPTPSTRTVNHEALVSEPTTAPALKGYNFQGWYTDAVTTQPYTFTTPVIQDMNLYAKWTIKTYTLTFNPNKPTLVGNTIAVTGMPTPSTRIVNHEAFVSEPATAPALIDYSFQGWYTDVATTQPYTFTTPVVQDTQLYAKWSVTINFTFNANKPSQVEDSVEVTNMPDPSTLKISQRTSVTEPSTEPVLLNYVFTGWYTQEEGGNKYNFDNPVNKTTTLYAQWGFRPETKEALVQEINRKIAADGNSPNLNYIDTSLISDMSDLFKENRTFNGNISGWNVSNVENMRQMFWRAFVFNQNLSSWNVSLVEDMLFMFAQAFVFNGNISSWNVSNVTNMRGMFGQATAFNQDLNNWNVERVTNMSDMFDTAIVFNGNISNWRPIALSDMENMFNNARSFKQDLESWNISTKVSTFLAFDGSGLDTDPNLSPPSWAL